MPLHKCLHYTASISYKNPSIPCLCSPHLFPDSVAPLWTREHFFSLSTHAYYGVQCFMHLWNNIQSKPAAKWIGKTLLIAHRIGPRQYWCKRKSNNYIYIMEVDCNTGKYATFELLISIWKINNDNRTRFLYNCQAN